MYIFIHVHNAYGNLFSVDSLLNYQIIIIMIIIYRLLLLDNYHYHLKIRIAPIAPKSN